MADKAKNPELRLRGGSAKTKDELQNIAKNIGVSLSALLWPKLREICDSYPDKMKQPPTEY